MRSLSVACAVVLSLSVSFSAAAQTTWPPVDGALPKTGDGSGDAAVIVGISNYLMLPQIVGAADNAVDWMKYLQDTRGVPMTQVQYLPNNEATKEAIIAAVQKATTQVKPGGTLWFVFIGHGAPAASHDDGVILGVDTQPTEMSLQSRGVPQKMLLDIIEQGPQEYAVTIFDACFSGTAGDGKTQLVPGSQATIPVKRIDPGVGRTAILSASNDVAGPLPKHDRPAFTYLMLGAMRGWADKDKDRTVTLAEAFDYTRDVLVTFVTGRNQIPNLSGRKEMPLSRQAVERGPDLTALRSSLVAKAPNQPHNLLTDTAGNLKPPDFDPAKFEAGFGDMSIEVERARDNAVRVAALSSSSGEEKRDGWCKLASFTEKNTYRAEAERLCLQWKKYVEGQTAALSALGNDYNFLSDYLTLDRTPEQKIAAMGSFIEKYGSFTTRQEVMAAKVAWTKMQAGQEGVLPKDTDGDGLLIDACPFEAEDFDGIEDDDGCPEVSAGEAISNFTDDTKKAIEESGFRLHVLSWSWFHIDTGASLGFGLWNNADFSDQLENKPIISWSNRLSYAVLELGVTVDFDLTRDLEDGGIYVTPAAGIRIFGVGPWTPTVGVDYRNVNGVFDKLRTDDAGLYIANTFGAGGFDFRITYRYSLRDVMPLNAHSGGEPIIPLHSIFIEGTLTAITPDGFVLFNFLD